MTDRELQGLRNLGGQSERAADEIARLRIIHETLLRGITDARCIIDPIWRERMGAESVREYVQRGLRCIDSAVADCNFFAERQPTQEAQA